MVIYKAANSVALTFDDGPNPKITPKILEVLREKGVQATFFLIGKRAEKYPEVVKKIIDDGHEIGNHSYTHPKLADLLAEKGNQAVIDEIKKSSEVLKAITGLKNGNFRFFRPPSLNWSNKVGEVVKPYYADRIIMTVVASEDWSWDDSKSWEESNLSQINGKTQEIVNWVENMTGNGSIIALHDGAEYGLPGHNSYANWMNRGIPTLQALPKIIDNLHAKGLAFKRLSDMELIEEQLA
jgi:peptidoglycan-N-acetylglucosamine deacetylase